MQRATLVRSHAEEEKEEQGPPEKQREFNTCSHQGGEGGLPLPYQRALPAHIKGVEGDTPT